jgi:glutamate---cysteine ligase / carboxylate-amine ligase
MLQAQIEVATAPHVDMRAAHAARQTLAAVAAAHGLAIITSGTHPTAAWQETRQTESDRYDSVVEDLQMIARRNYYAGCTSMSSCRTRTRGSA